jgi:PAS domain S-box-containing protein
MIEVVILATSVTLQLLAAVLALRMIRVTGRRLAWISISAAVLLMAVRRGSALLVALQNTGTGPGVLLSAELIALVISALLVLGLASIGPMLKSLRRAEELEEGFGRIIDSSLNEIYVFAADDLRFIRVNRGARNNLGYDEAELSTLTPVDIKPEFDEDRLRRALEPLADGHGSRVRFQTRHERKDGTTYPVDVDIQAARLDGREVCLAVINDTSHRETAERALRESEEHFRSLIEHSQDLTTVLDWDGNLVYQSPSIVTILGHDPEDRIGRHIFDLMHPDDQAPVKRAMALARSGTLPESPLLYRLRHADGSWRTMEGIGSIRTLPSGAQEVVINQRDITEREIAVEKHRQAEALLQHTQRMETIGTFAGGIAHDFNNLLTPVVGYAELLSERLEDDPDAHEDVEEILKAAARARELVQQLMVFGHRAEPRLESVAVEDVVKEAMGLVRVAAPQSVTLSIDLQSEGEAVLADPIQLHQIVMNLCTNAVHSMSSKGGELHVSLRPTDECPTHLGKPGEPREGAFVCLTVQDTGDGMDATTVERVFEPFFTTKASGKGTGLGLAVVHGIVLNHDGAITVESAPGDGTTFHVYLPSLGFHAEAKREAPPAQVAGTERVLIVDDDAAVIRVLTRLLERQGYRVEATEDPTKALDRICQGESLDLVITDFDMPQMNGLELTQNIRSRQHEVPIILITGLGDAATDERLTEVGIAAKVTKPFTGPTIVGKVREVLDMR